MNDVTDNSILSLHAISELRSSIHSKPAWGARKTGLREAFGGVTSPPADLGRDDELGAARMRPMCSGAGRGVLAVSYQDFGNLSRALSSKLTSGSRLTSTSWPWGR